MLADGAKHFALHLAEVRAKNYPSEQSRIAEQRASTRPT
jgi:hypothetical protein